MTSFASKFKCYNYNGYNLSMPLLANGMRMLKLVLRLEVNTKTDLNIITTQI